MVAIRQTKTATFNGTLASLAFDNDPIAQNLCVAVLRDRGGAGSFVAPSGWTKQESGGPADVDEVGIYSRSAPGGALAFTMVTGPTNEQRLTIIEFDVPATAQDTAPRLAGGPAYNVGIGPVDAIAESILVGSMAAADPGGGRHITYDEGSTGFTTVDQGSVAGGLTPESVVSWRTVTVPAPYSYAPGANEVITQGGALVCFTVSQPLTADFEGIPRSGDAPLTVDFTDESFGGSGTVDTWAWDFGDGTTSTSANPSHDFQFPGTYNVTLTVTTDIDETDSVTKTAYITVEGDHDAPAPGGAILEIYAGATGAARWGSAHWGQDVWNSAGWVDVTPQGITVVIRWGSHSPERGVLAEVEAASWLVTTYDPDRLLDPGNDDSPYHTDLVAGLPIRLRHRGTVIRQGFAERIAYFHADTQGAIRATDNVSLMARTPVPADSVVADTLRARARDVIAAAGLHITVEPDPPAGDPALAPRIEGDRSVWRHVADGAEQTLHMAYVDRVGTLRFRPWDTPYDRARGVDETNLVDLGTQVDIAGLYSVVQAIDSITETVVERRLTPTPKWGAVTYSRDELTIDAGDWAEAVLADRSLQTVQWIPGMIWPLSADDVEYFATLEAVERFTVDHRATEPVVDITGIIVGGEIHVTGKRESAALWSFELELAQTAETPLYTDTDPPEFLRNEAGDGYLYAD